MEIITNYKPREIIFGFELDEKELAEFDYMSEEELACSWFVRYKGELYDIGEFMLISDTMRLHYNYGDWQGYMSDSYFSGILIKFVNSDFVIVATYIC